MLKPGSRNAAAGAAASRAKWQRRAANANGHQSKPLELENVVLAFGRGKQRESAGADASQVNNQLPPIG